MLSEFFLNFNSFIFFSTSSFFQQCSLHLLVCISVVYFNMGSNERLFTERVNNESLPKIHYAYAGIECLCSAETMGRNILGSTTTKSAKSAAFHYNIWTCHGGNIALFFPCRSMNSRWTIVLKKSSDQLRNSFWYDKYLFNLITWYNFLS